jgi:hypothetical protein
MQIPLKTGDEYDALTRVLVVRRSDCGSRGNGFRTSKHFRPSFEKGRVIKRDSALSRYDYGCVSFSELLKIAPTVTLVSINAILQ